MDDEDRGYIFLTHLFAVIPIWGILFNGIIWLSFKERSRKVVFNAHQAIYFQSIFLFAELVGFVVALFALLVGVLNASLGAILCTANTIMMCLILAIYEFFCFYAMWNVLQGNEYEYPFVGQRLKENDDSIKLTDDEFGE